MRHTRVGPIARYLCRIVTVAALVATAHVFAQSNVREEKFLQKIEEYEAADRVSPPPTGAILLVGDSQFYRWTTLREDLAGYTLINRGVDSFQFSHLIRFSDRLIAPYKARMILVHAGGNDVHNGKSPARVLADFKTFVSKVRATNPEVPIVFSGITPGPGRWDEADQRRQANLEIKRYIQTQENLHFVDLWDAMLTADGQPREELWVEDRVHPNHAGYLLRATLTKPFLGEPDQAPSTKQ